MSKRYSLKFKAGPLAGKTFSIGPGEYFFIGSGEQCAVRIPDDPTVSPSHACVFYEPSGKILFKDVGSSTGTFVNGKRITSPVILNPGDHATIGQISAFQSSWWNALQATRLTQFSRFRAAPNVDPAGVSKAGARRLIILLAILCGISGIATWKFLDLEANDDVEFVGNGRGRGGKAMDGRGEHRRVKDKDEGIFSGVLSARLFGAKPKKPARKGVEITPERQFIWDEIVAISRRFGDPPPSAMDPGFIKEVERHILRFTKNGAHHILLDRKAQYWPQIEQVLIGKGLPPELGYVVWVESNFKDEARSGVGAAGLWQFMPDTAQEYGLVVNGTVDDRLDPKKSTYAAADYFTSLLRMFGTERYLLALASYNTGQSRVKRMQLAATVQKERSIDFWQIRHALPTETMEYVPKIIAAIIIGRNPQRWDISH